MIHQNKSSPGLSSTPKYKSTDINSSNYSRKVYAPAPKANTLLQLKNSLPQINSKIIFQTTNSNIQFGFDKKSQYLKKQIGSFKLIRSKLSQLNFNRANKTITIDPKVIQQIQSNFSIKPNTITIHSFNKSKDMKRLSSNDLRQKYSNYISKRQEQKNRKQYENFLLLKGDIKGWGHRQAIGFATFYESMQSNK